MANGGSRRGASAPRDQTVRRALDRATHDVPSFSRRTPSAQAARSACVERRAQHADLGDDGRDVGVRRDVEGGVVGSRALGRHARAAERRDLVLVSLLDGDLGAGPNAQIDGRERRRHVERHAVLLGQHRDGVGADLVGRVAVGGDAVGADDDAVDGAAAHEVAGHVVGDQAIGDALDRELPGRETGALQPGPRLVDEDLGDAASARARRGSTPRAVPYPAVARAPALQCVRMRAPRLNSAAPCAPMAQAAARRRRRGSSRALVEQRRAGDSAGVAGAAPPDGAHLGDRPGEVDGRGPRGGEAGGGLFERGAEPVARRRARPQQPRAAASARAPAAATPIAGAPRTVMSRMRAATSRQVAHAT